MKYLVTLLFAALTVWATETDKASTCVATYNSASGMISASGSALGIDCTYYLVPPSSDYNYVTITFSHFNTETDYDIVYVYDGPNNSSDLINTLTGNLGSRIMSTTQPFATIRYTTDTYGTSVGWVVNFQFSKLPAPSCAGPKYISNWWGYLNAEITGANSPEVACQWIFVPNADWSLDDCSSSYYFYLNSLEDDTSSAVVSVFDTPGSDIGFVGYLTEGTPYYYANVQEAASITVDVSTYSGSNTSVSIEFQFTTYCPSYPSGGDSSSWWGSSSSSYHHHPWFWIAVIASGAFAVVLVIAFIVRCFTRRCCKKSGYAPVPQMGHYVAIPMMQTPQGPMPNPNVPAPVYH
mmetsp:Transcript_9004/g.12385  ORF Transcript_9004/g.12385 Transcript_9004/m.12385 type:complete len:350 (-) Transcript_9004:26-1075(-)